LFLRRAHRTLHPAGWALLMLGWVLLLESWVELLSDLMDFSRARFPGRTDVFPPSVFQLVS